MRCNERNRRIYFLVGMVILLCGILSRSNLVSLPEFVRLYAGDTLWAMLVFVGIATIFIRWSPGFVAFSAMLFATLIEISQLYHANWIDTVRKTTLGGLVLGYGFLWSDLLCYFVGIFTCWMTEVSFTGLRRNPI